MRRNHILKINVLAFCIMAISISGKTVTVIPNDTCKQGQTICIGNRYTLYSHSLQEEREYWVHVPESYGKDDTQHFPVIYLLDGDSFFHTLVGIHKTLSKGKGRFYPPCIIVGVLNTDRTRDLTPTASAAGRDGKIHPDAQVQGGGSAIFTRFLTRELRSVINQTYRTNGKNILIGHSYAGLFTINTFLYHNDLFDIYLALDPSLWWDQGKLVKAAESLVQEKDFSGKSLYIGLATRPRPDRRTIHLSQSEELVSNILPQAHNLRFFYKAFPEETHGTIAIPGLFDGLKRLFEE